MCIHCDKLHPAADALIDHASSFKVKAFLLTKVDPPELVLALADKDLILKLVQTPEFIELWDAIKADSGHPN